MAQVETRPEEVTRLLEELKNTFSAVQAECDPQVAASADFMIGLLEIFLAATTDSSAGISPAMFDAVKMRIAARLGPSSEFLQTCVKQLDDLRSQFERDDTEG